VNVIFSAPPVPGTGKLANGKEILGLLSLEVQTYAAGETGAVGPSGREPDDAAKWLKQTNIQDQILISPPPIMGGPAVAVPAALLRALPLDTWVVMEWKLRPPR
jgi:hypothetical protein